MSGSWTPAAGTRSVAPGVKPVTPAPPSTPNRLKASAVTVPSVGKLRACGGGIARQQRPGEGQEGNGAFATPPPRLAELPEIVLSVRVRVPKRVRHAAAVVAGGIAGDGAVGQGEGAVAVPTPPPL